MLLCQLGARFTISISSSIIFKSKFSRQVYKLVDVIGLLPLNEGMVEYHRVPGAGKTLRSLTEKL